MTDLGNGSSTAIPLSPSGGEAPLLEISETNGASEKAHRRLRLLAVSLDFPPLAYPQSIQIARLLRHLRGSTLLVCGDEQGTRRDYTIEPDVDSHLEKCVRVPFSPSPLRVMLSRVARRLRLPLWDRLPDGYRPWMGPAMLAVEGLLRLEADRVDALITFGHPMVDHLIGLELKKRHHLPWVAHFCDPWVDNPFTGYDWLSRHANRILERRVLSAVDRVVFTSVETERLVMSKYPPNWRAKSCVVPHSFDPSLYPESSERGNALVVRYLGNFYGLRTPIPLLRAIRQLVSSDPACLRGVRFELVGRMNPSIPVGSLLDDLPLGLVEMKPEVPYAESLSLMASADGLLVIDAPAEESPFLPSKLVDYLGAARAVLGITPRGAAAALIQRLGGRVADPSDDAAVADALRDFVESLRHHRGSGCMPWGEATVRREYEARRVAAQFEGLLQELLA